MSPSAFNKLGDVHYFARRYDDAIRNFGSRSISIPLSRRPRHAGTGVCGERYADRAVENSSVPRALLGPRPDVVASTPTSWLGRDATRSACDARRIAAYFETSGSCAVSCRLCAPRAWRYRRAFEWLQKAMEASDWQMGCSRSSRPSTPCGLIPALLRLSSASGFHDRRMLTAARTPDAGPVVKPARATRGNLR